MTGTRSTPSSPTPPMPPMPPMHRTPLRALGPPRRERLPTGVPVWVVTRYADVRRVLTDHRIGRASMFAPGAPPVATAPGFLDDPASLLNLDGEEHRRLRQTVQRAFTPRAVARWRPWVASVVEDLLDELERQGPPADLIAGFVEPLPSTVICRLMALEGHDTAAMSRWSSVALSRGAYTPEEVQEALAEFGSFMAGLLAARRADPGDDLVSGLVAAADEESGTGSAAGGIDESRLVSLARVLVVAGMETTQVALGNSILYLLDEAPEAWRRLSEAGTEDEAGAAPLVEQLLRLIPRVDVSAGDGILRQATADIEIGGVAVAAGDVLAVDILAAGRDPEVFAPDLCAGTDRLFSPLPAQSLAFGAGPHHCLGAWLARMTMELALHRLAHRMPGLRLTGPMDAIEWRRGMRTRSPLRLEVAW
ncbi:cytochrome P450 [Streptomyces sp. P1-3]|uniref:cytochrome P450 n=1 Tax=Streptomyces sp. P1-3 TaxID=3421658 RepID=UPI003D36D5D8